MLLREFYHVFQLPDDVNVEQMRSMFTRDGLLHIDSPLHRSWDERNERFIEIEHK